MRRLLAAILLASAESATLIAARGETSPVTVSESDTRSGRRLLDGAAEERKHGDSGELSSYFPRAEGKKEKKTDKSTN